MIHGSIKTPLQNKTLIPNGLRTSNIWDRMRGLLGRKQLDEEQGLWISPCPSVHTIGMRYPIDVVFLDSDKKVVFVKNDFRPFSFFSCPVKCRYVLELKNGLGKYVDVGDFLEFS